MKCLIYCKEGKSLFVSDENDIFGGERLNNRIIGFCEIEKIEKIENYFIWKLYKFKSFKKSKSLISFPLTTLKNKIIDLNPKNWKYCYSLHSKQKFILISLSPKECETLLEEKQINYNCKNYPKKIKEGKNNAKGNSKV